MTQASSQDSLRDLVNQRETLGESQPYGGCSPRDFRTSGMAGTVNAYGTLTIKTST